MKTNAMRFRGLILAAALLATASLPAAAQESARAAYLQYCSACHGESGKGDGVVSGFMRPPATDLTQLAKKAGGELPYGRLMHVIDGRETIRAHGNPDMPVWGEVFRAEAGQSIAQSAIVRGKVLLITEYLSTIQEK